MITPTEMIEGIKDVKAALNVLEIRGEQNANNLLFACQKCDMLITALKDIINESKGRNLLSNEVATEAGED